MKSFTYLFCLIFMCFAHAASAIPLAASDDAGFRGQSVVIMLTDPTPVDLYALWFHILFDPNVLTFNETLSSSLDLPTFVPTTGAVEVFSSSFGPPITNVSTELMQAWFTIRDNAPFGETSVTFQCHDVGNNLGCVDYPFDPVSAKITVLRSSQIPLPATLWLLALGMTALAGARLRR